MNTGSTSSIILTNMEDVFVPHICASHFWKYSLELSRIFVNFDIWIFIVTIVTVWLLIKNLNDETFAFNKSQFYAYQTFLQNLININFQHIHQEERILLYKRKDCRHLLLEDKLK